jgi:hypothetical protein
MPCPYFEPQTAAETAPDRGARLPLIREYDGLCRADSSAVPAPEAMRFQGCNHGYSRGLCERFPIAEQRSCLRYHLIRRTPSALDVLCVEEQDYAPVRWYEVKYLIVESRIEPEMGDACIRAQILALCRGYLERFAEAH